MKGQGFNRGKVRYVLLGVLILLSLGASFVLRGQDAPPDAPPPDNNSAQDNGGPANNGNTSDASFQTFYDSLASQGTWIQSPDYGYVWQPNVTDAQWAPYTNGHWVYTEDGWTWVSDEPFGWATYHYGRWVNLDDNGWCWVPGYTWGPAWVSWRYGDGYCGWAPLPPDSLVGIDYASGDTDFGDGFHIGGDCDAFYGIGAGWYNFLPVVYLGDTNYRGYYASRYNNFRLINRTTNVTNINVNRRERSGRFGGVSLGGPSYLQAEAASQKPIPRVGLSYTDRVGGGAIEGNSVAIYAPRVDASTIPSSRPAGTVRAMAHVGVNRGTDLSRPLLVNSHLASPAATSTEIHQAQAAQSEAPSSARLATADKNAPPSGNASFTSMRRIDKAGDAGTRAGGRSEESSSRGSSVYGHGGVYRSANPNLGGDSRYSRPSGSGPNYRSPGARPGFNGPAGSRGGGPGGQHK